MAKIISEHVSITFSKIVKNNESASVSITNDEVRQALEQVAQELVGENVIVEVNEVDEV